MSCVTLFDNISLGCRAMSKLKITYDRTDSDEDQKKSFFLKKSLNRKSHNFEKLLVKYFQSTSSSQIDLVDFVP